jgi:hypothetical protein
MTLQEISIKGCCDAEVWLYEIWYGSGESISFRDSSVEPADFWVLIRILFCFRKLFNVCFNSLAEAIKDFQSLE